MLGRSHHFWGKGDGLFKSKPALLSDLSSSHAELYLSLAAKEPKNHRRAPRDWQEFFKTIKNHEE